MLLYKDVFAAESSRLVFFKTFTYGLSLGGAVLLSLAAVYFARQSRSSAAAG
jgi:hypothetical protein